jgi:hypothetical protein
MGHPDRVCRICGEAGERMASLVCLAPRNLRQRFRWRRLGVDPLAPTQARSMGISHEAAKSGHTTALLGRDPIVVSPGAISIRRPGQRDEAAHPPSSVRRFGCQFKTRLYQFCLGERDHAMRFCTNLPPIDPVPSVGMRPALLTRTESVVKRASDIALAVTALVLRSL